MANEVILMEYGPLYTADEILAAKATIARAYFRAGGRGGVTFRQKMVPTMTKRDTEEAIARATQHVVWRAALTNT